MFINLLVCLFFRYSFSCTPTYHRSELNKSSFSEIFTVFLCFSPNNTEQSSAWKFKLQGGRLFSDYYPALTSLETGGWPQRECSFQDRNRTKGRKGTEGFKIRIKNRRKKKKELGARVAFLNRLKLTNDAQLSVVYPHMFPHSHWDLTFAGAIYHSGQWCAHLPTSLSSPRCYFYNYWESFSCCTLPELRLTTHLLYSEHMERWGWVCSGGIGGGDRLPARYEKRSQEERRGLTVSHYVDALRPHSVPLYLLTNALCVHWRICLLEQMMYYFFYKY